MRDSRRALRWTLLATLALVCGPLSCKGGCFKPRRQAKTLVLEIDAQEPTKTRDGLSLRLKVVGHKRMHGGGGKTMYELQLTKGKKRKVLEYMFGTGDRFWYFEGIAFGYLVTVEPVLSLQRQRKGIDSNTPAELAKKWEQRTVTLKPTSLRPLPEDPDEAQDRKRARKAQQKLGCVGALEERDDAWYVVGKDNRARCAFIVGPYSGRILVERNPKPL